MLYLEPLRDEVKVEGEIQRWKLSHRLCQNNGDESGASSSGCKAVEAEQGQVCIQVIRLFNRNKCGSFHRSNMH